jgi:hypothetical protein
VWLLFEPEAVEEQPEPEKIVIDMKAAAKQTSTSRTSAASRPRRQDNAVAASRSGHHAVTCVLTVTSST